MHPHLTQQLAGERRRDLMTEADRARLAVRVDPSLAGRRLRLEVEATDVRGRRQLERNAGSIRVAR